MQINYQQYTSEELNDVICNVDRDKYPERYQEALKLLESRKPLGSKSHNDLNSDEHSFWFPKRSTKGKIISSCILFLVIAGCLFYGVFPWRDRVITFEDEPYLFLTIIVFLLIVGIAQLFTIKSKVRKGGSET